MLLIPAWIMKIHFSMLNNRVVPVGNIDRPIRSHCNVYRPEGNVVSPQQVFGKFGSKPTSLFFYCESVDSVRPEIIGNKISLPISHMTSGDDVQATVLRLSRI